MMIPEPLLRTEDYVILDIADMIRRDGNRLYGISEIGGASYQASLCGLTAAFARNGDIMMLKSPDLHVTVDLEILPIDENDEIEHYKNERTDVHAVYLAGDIGVLRNWHSHLCAYRRSMRTAGAFAAA